MKFTKLQGAGNDFVLIEGDRPLDWKTLAAIMCDRHFGIGADGLLVLFPSDKAGFKMRVFNPDGSEAEACGNGLRCFSRYILVNELVNNNTKEIRIETIAGTRTVQFDKANRKEAIIQVSLGKPKFKATEIPVLAQQPDDNSPILDYPLIVAGTELKMSFVSMGNPHAVHFTQQAVADFPLARLGPAVENHSLFPRRVNFEVANIKSRTRIEIRVWERGAGETLACGSGAAATAVAARLHGYVDSNIEVIVPGGVLNIQWDGNGEVFLSGPAKVVFTGEWPIKEQK
ncbi:MAG: diaminopimelate epimerase [Dehalococcoidales bacterium]|nr:diaminopimelate epimerase [Dehalococcoidales bacterium]